MNHIYVIISRTNTRIGSFIRKFTSFEYNHVSLSFSKEIETMYSFARYNINKPFKGGFVEESWRRYLVTDKDIQVLIYRVPVREQNYQNVLIFMDKMLINPKMYRYSFIEAALPYIPFMRYESKTNYTCLTFAIKILRIAGIIAYNDDFETIRELSERLKIFPCEIKTLHFRNREDYNWNNDSFYIVDHNIRTKIFNYLRKRK